MMGWCGPLTHRQAQTWKKWLHDEWEKPDRTDRYIMRLTYIVDNIFTKIADLPPEDNYRLRFQTVKPQQQQSTVPTQSTPRTPIDPTGQTVVGLPPPSSQEEHAAKTFIGDADPSTIVDVQSDDEDWKRQRRMWLAYAGIKTDKDGNVIRPK